MLRMGYGEVGLEEEHSECGVAVEADVEHSEEVHAAQVVEKGVVDDRSPEVVDQLGHRGGLVVGRIRSPELLDFQGEWRAVAVDLDPAHHRVALWVM